MFQAPRGTTDILPEDQPYWNRIMAEARHMGSQFGYSRIDTPIFEDTQLFARGIGDTTDIVEKETYSFKDRGGDSLTLRPEGTAPVCRAYMEHGMHTLPQPVKLYYICQNFRYERPQSGRYRAFNQFGVEIFGESDPYADAEAIEISWRFLNELGLTDLSLSLNSIGDDVCRPLYISALTKYYTRQSPKLCEDCTRRLVTNPLRLLDCKTDTCQPVISGAPRSIDYLCNECEVHWEDLLDHLNRINLAYKVDNSLVRGLDYYTRTVFEITPPTEGRTNVIAGGGRYDKLLEQLGGPSTPGVGFAIGLERAVEHMKRLNIALLYDVNKLTLVAHLGSRGKKEAMAMASMIRKAGGTAVMGPSRGLRSQLRYASSIGADYAVIIGDDEIAKGKFTLRKLKESIQREVSPNEIIRSVC